MSCTLPGCGGLLCSQCSIFSAVKLPSVSRHRLWALCWQHSRQHLSMLMTFTIWRSRSVPWDEVFGAQSFCGRIVTKLGAAVTRRLALCLPVVLQQRRLKWLRRQRVWEQSTAHPSPRLAALFGTFSWSEPPVKTDGTPTAPRLLVINADDLKAVGLPLTSQTLNVDLIQGRLSMPSEENPLTEDDEPALPLELQHPCDECEWIGRSEGSLRGHKIMAHGYRSQIELSCAQCPQCEKKFTTISNARVHIKRQSCSRSKSCNIRSIFYSTRPEQPRPKTVCAPVGSNTTPSAHGAISHGRPAEIRQEAEESFRGDRASLDFYFRTRQSNDQPGTATQGSRDSHELSRRCIEESRNTVSYGPRHRTSTDTDQGPIYVQRDTDRKRTSPDGTTTSHFGQSVGAMATLPASFGRPLRQVSRQADQPRGSGTMQREPSRGSEDQKGRQHFTPRVSMERGIPDAHPLGPTTTERRSPLRLQPSWHRSPSHCQSSPRSHQRQGTGRGQGNTKKQ